LVVRRPDGRFVQITPPAGVDYTMADLLAVYRSLTFSQEQTWFR
jgi:hypothetical protein